MTIKKEYKRASVWFHIDDKKRYNKLKLDIPFHIKIKQLFNNFMRKQERG